MARSVTEEENHLLKFRIVGLPYPDRNDEAATKLYVDRHATGGGGTSIFLDGGSPSTDYTDGPSIDCGGVT